MKLYHCIVFLSLFLFNEISFAADSQIAVNFSHTRGFYTENFDLEIETSGYNISVLYTLDGSDPLEAANPIIPLDKNRFTININHSTVVKIYVYNDEENISFAHSYILIDDIFEQNNESVINRLKYPPIWGYGTSLIGTINCIRQNADYDMTIDTCITDIPNYEQRLLDGLMEIPSISISLDKDFIFGADSGIYVFPVEKSDECYTLPDDVDSWERKASVEIFNDGQNPDISGFQLNAGLQMSGASTRYLDFYKHSFKLKFRSEYGSSKLNYPLYGDEGTDKFESLQLRMVGHCSPHDWVNSRREETQFHKDNWVRNTQREMSGFGSSPNGKFVHLFINGLYWGLYDISERPDADYMAEYYGGIAEDYDVLKIREVKSGTDSAYNYMYDLGHSIYDTILTNPETNPFTGEIYYDVDIVTNEARANSFYNEMKSRLDINNFIDYNLLNLYIVNTDWKENNWWAARNAKENGKFQFFAWDAEIVLTDAGKSNQVLLYAGNTGKAQKYHPIDLNQRLLDVPEYKIKFGDHIQCNCVEEDGVLNPDNFLASYKATEAEIHNASLLEFARWGDVRKLDVRYDKLCPSIVDETLYKYETEVFPDLLNNLMVYYGRPGGDFELFPHYIKKVRRNGEYVLEEIFNIKAVKFPILGGEVSNGYQLNLTNLNTKYDENNELIPLGDIYYTTDGSDPRNVDGTVALSATKYTGPIVIDEYKMIKARVFVDTLNYRDIIDKTIYNVWTAMCPREFFPEGYYDDLVINEIHYNPANLGDVSGNNLEFIEIKNISADEINVSNTKFTEGIAYQFPMGSIIPSNGFTLLALDSIAVSNHYGVAVNGQYNGKLSNGGELITLSKPDDAIIDAVDFKDTWNIKTDGAGASLSLYLDQIDSENNDFSTSWGSSAGGSTPNEENVFCLPIIFDIEAYDPSCYNGNDGYISLDVTGGTAPYNINWLEGNSSANIFSNLISGSYEVEVTDDQGCEKTEIVTLTNPETIESNLQIYHSTTANSSDGYAIVTPENTTSGYNITWSNGSSNNTNYNLTSGENYWVTITDMTNSVCSITESFTVEIASACASPVNLSVISTSEQSAIISWTGNIDNTSYTVSYKTIEDANWTSVSTSVPNLLLNNLQPCKKYQYKVSADCNLTPSNTSTVKTFTTSGCNTVCGGVVNGNAVNITNHSAFILWDIIPAATYVLNYRKNGVNNWYKYETALNFSILFGLNNCSNYEWFIEVHCPNGTITTSSTYNFTTNDCFKTINNDINTEKEDLTNNFNFTLYPNPAQDFIKIKAENSQQTEQSQVLIYDFSGKLVKNGGSFIESTILNINDILPGMYIAQITSKNISKKYIFTKT